MMFRLVRHSKKNLVLLFRRILDFWRKRGFFWWHLQTASAANWNTSSDWDSPSIAAIPDICWSSFHIGILASSLETRAEIEISKTMAAFYSRLFLP